MKNEFFFVLEKKKNIYSKTVKLIWMILFANLEYTVCATQNSQLSIYRAPDLLQLKLEIFVPFRWLLNFNLLYHDLCQQQQKSL